MVLSPLCPLQADQHHLSRRRKSQDSVGEETQLQPEETRRATGEEETSRDGQTDPGRDDRDRPGRYPNLKSQLLYFKFLRSFFG